MQSYYAYFDPDQEQQTQQTTQSMPIQIEQ